MRCISFSLPLSCTRRRQFSQAWSGGHDSLDILRRILKCSGRGIPVLLLPSCQGHAPLLVDMELSTQLFWICHGSLRVREKLPYIICLLVN